MKNQNKKDRQNAPIITRIGAVALILVFGGVAIFRAKKKTSQRDSSLPLTPTPAISKFAEATEPNLKISLDAARTSGLLIISEIDKQFSSLEYELIYQSEIGGAMIERGIYSGGTIPIPSTRKVSKDLFFGTKSCTTGKCHVRAEKVEVDQPVTLIIRLLNDEKEIWELEKTVLFDQGEGGFKGTIEEQN